MNATQPLLVVLSGPAGSGKSTLCDRLVREYPEFKRVVTATTRAPRPGEEDGVHYHFYSIEEFKLRAARNEFVEWCEVHGSNRFYGTPAASIFGPLHRGEHLVMNVDIKGAQSLRFIAEEKPALRSCLVTVFVNVSLREMANRLLGRGETDEEIARRMRTAHDELRQARTFDYQFESHARDEDFAALMRCISDARQKKHTSTAA